MASLDALGTLAQPSAAGGLGDISQALIFHSHEVKNNVFSWMEGRQHATLCRAQNHQDFLTWTGLGREAMSEVELF